jgi:5,10-methylenetetrahydrofolate reductase
MSLLEQQLAAGKFTVTAEVAPPKGIELAPVLAVAARLQGVTAVNVTDNQGANMRLCALVLGG